MTNQNHWENPRIFNINKERPHASAIYYPTLKSCTSGDPSPWQQSLNGLWKFHWAKRPADRPRNFFQPDFDISSWVEIPVPAQWQLEGYGKPHYMSDGGVKGMGKKDPPNIDPDYNEVGSYRRTFTVPGDWDDKQVFIHFAGVKTAFYLWLNGEFIGYSQGSMCPAEFNLTRHLQLGENTIAVEVYRYSDGAYLEDQDMWYMSGIYREVYLVAVPEIHIRDFFTRCKFDSQLKDAELLVDAEIQNFGKPLGEGYQLEVRLLAPDGKKLISSQAQKYQPSNNSETRLGFTLKAAAPVKWSAETPVLHIVQLILWDPKHNEVEATQIYFGFRKVEIQENKILVNGRNIVFRGG
jgi:beta-galactosidase